MCSRTISHCGDGFGRFGVSFLTLEKTLRILSGNRQIKTKELVSNQNLNITKKKNASEIQYEYLSKILIQ